MRIGLLCATRRGYIVLEKLVQLLPQSDFVVFSFREEPWEPPFLNDICQLTLAHGGQFFESRQVGHQCWTQFWNSMSLDLMLVVSWRYMIPPEVYRRPRLGTFVFHDSLLPEYRGFSPTVWAIINGENHTGATLFEIAEGVDEGDIVDQQVVPIGPDDIISAVMERVTQTYLTLLKRNLDSLINGTAPRIPQDHSRATYTCKRLPEDSHIDWSAPSTNIYNLIRAVTFPYSGAYTYLSGQKLYIWNAKRVINGRRYIANIPGRIVEIRPGEGVVVLTGNGSILLTQVQKEGDKNVNAAEIIKSLNHSLGR